MRANALILDIDNDVAIHLKWVAIIFTKKKGKTFRTVTCENKTCSPISTHYH